MTRDEAIEHLGKEILYEQGMMRYCHGTVIGVVDRPSVVIEDATGYRFVFALETVQNVRRMPSDEETRAALGRQI